MPAQAEQPAMENEDQLIQQQQDDGNQPAQDQNQENLAQEEAFLEAQAQSLAEVKRRRKE